MPALPSLGANSGVFRRATASSMAVGSGVSNVCSCGRREYEVHPRPLLGGELASSRSIACACPTQGSRTVPRSPPTVATRRTRTTTMPTQLNTTRHGCAAQARVQPAERSRRQPLVGSAPPARWSDARGRQAAPVSSWVVLGHVYAPSCRIFRGRRTEALKLIGAGWNPYFAGLSFAPALSRRTISSMRSARTSGRRSWRRSSGDTPCDRTARASRKTQPPPARR